MNNLTIALSAAAGNAGGEETNPNAWDISYSELDTISSNFFDMDEMILSEEISFSAQEGQPRGIFFKPDGTKMYLVGSQGDDVNEFNLSTAWKIATATYSQSFSVNTQDGFPNALYFSPDGTKFFIGGDTTDSVYRYDLSTAWDVSTASYQQALDISAKEAIITGLALKSDGTKLFVSGDTNDSVHEYDLSTAWDLSTASFSQSFSYTSPTNYEGRPMDFHFASDGTAFWISGLAGDGIDEFSLSTAWDVSTASHVQYLKLYNNTIGNSAGNVNATVEYQPLGIYWSPDGDHFYMTGNISDKVHHYNVGVKYLNVSSQEINPNSISFNNDGTKLYIMGSTGDDINEYDLSTAWDVSTGTYLQNFSVNAQETAPQGMFFKPDGTKVYITGQSGDDVNEYDLSTAWDISTMSYNQNFSVASQETTPAGVCFKDDGTKMYVIGTTGDDVNEYDLSTAWDVSTASYSQAFSVNSQETAPRGVIFKPDGTKMYIAGSNGDEVNEYDLSTAWDVSTASHVQFYKDNQAADTVVTDVFFKPDGTRYWITGRTNDRVYQYNIRSS